MKGMLIRLSDSEVKYCKDLGAKRHFAKHPSFRNKDRFDEFSVESMPHILGVIGELAYAKLYGKKVDEEIYEVRDDGTDFDGETEVRTVTYAGSGTVDLKVPQSEYDRKSNVKTYVLAHVNQKKLNEVRLLGEISRDNFDKRKKKMQYGIRNPVNWIVTETQLDPLKCPI